MLRVLDGTGLHETAHTRILAWIFDPKKKSEHQLPEDLFSGVLDFVTRETKWPEGNYLVTSVKAERSTSDGKRTDIWVEGTVTPQRRTKKWLIVIEAKVNAQLTDQLHSYEKEADDWQKKGNDRLQPCFVYLNDGYSVDDETLSKVWVGLSFIKLFEIIWRKVNTHSSAAGFHFVRYYLSGILSEIEGWSLPLEADDHVDYEMIEFCNNLNIIHGGD